MRRGDCSYICAVSRRKNILGRGNSTWGKGTEECGVFEEQNVNMAREELT